MFEARVTGVEDAHGNPVESWSPPVVVEGCAFAPQGTVETFTPGRNMVSSSPMLYVPTGTVVSARDRVTVRGSRFLVDGDPAVWVNPYTGSRPGVAVKLERVAG